MSELQQKVEESNKEILEKAREDEDRLVEVNNQLLEANNRINDYEAKMLENAEKLNIAGFAWQPGVG